MKTFGDEFNPYFSQIFWHELNNFSLSYGHKFCYDLLLNRLSFKQSSWGRTALVALFLIIPEEYTLVIHSNSELIIYPR